MTAETISAQLRQLAPTYDWDSGEINRSIELAKMLVRAGIEDPSKIVLAKSLRVEKPSKANEGLSYYQYVLIYNNKRFGFLGEPDRASNEEFLQDDNGAISVAWSPYGHGSITYHIVPSAFGFRFVPYWGSSSDAAEARFIAKFFGSVILGSGAVSFASTIGTAVMGAEMAATYPALANAIGQVAITTAYNGGNVEGAVKTSLLSQAGAAAGAAVGGAALTLTEIETVAKLAAAATSAVITGADLKTAVTLSLLRSGSGYSETTLKETPVGNDFVQMDGPDFEMINQPDPSNDFKFYEVDMGLYQTFDTPLTDVGFLTPIVPQNSPVAFGAYDYSIPELAPVAIPNIQIAEPPIIPVTDPIAATPWNAQQTINTVSQLALSAISLMGAFQKLKNPTINPVARNVTSSGALVSALDTGVVQTRTADGKVTNQRPPVNVAQSTITGNIVVNNGDGTYTLIEPSGNKRIIKYGEGSGSLLTDLPWPTIGAAVGVIALVMRFAK